MDLILKLKSRCNLTEAASHPASNPRYNIYIFVEFWCCLDGDREGPALWSSATTVFGSPWQDFVHMYSVIYCVYGCLIAACPFCRDIHRCPLTVPSSLWCVVYLSALFVREAIELSWLVSLRKRCHWVDRVLMLWTKQRHSSRTDSM